MEKLLTLKEVSEILGVAKVTLRRWDNEGKLKALRTVGNARRYSEDSINNFMENMKKNDQKVND